MEGSSDRRTSDASDPSFDVEVGTEEWIPRVMRHHSDVLELRERLRPLSEDTTFARLARDDLLDNIEETDDDVSSSTLPANTNIAKTQVKEVLSHEAVTQLILQFLDEEGLVTTKKLLEKESGIKFGDANYGGEKGMLMNLLAAAITDTQNIFEEDERDSSALATAIPGAEQTNGLEDGDKEVELYNYSYSAIKDQELAMDVNVWDEGEDSPDNIVTKMSDDGKKCSVVAATFNKLIEWLTSDRNSDLEFRKVFLTTYPMYVSSEGFLKKLIERYLVDDKYIPANMPPDGFRKKLAFRIVTCIKYWISNNPGDWNDRVNNTLIDFIDNFLSIDGFKDFAQSLRTSLAKKDDIQKTSSDVFVEPRLPKGVSLFSPTITIKDVPEEEVARQLTLIDFTIYSSVQPFELLSGGWYKRKYASFNVLASIEHFNNIASWVATTILKCDNVKDRTKALCRFITIAEQLLSLNSFNMLMAVTTSIQSQPIQRLKFTWKEVPTSMRQFLTDLNITNPHGGYKYYKEAYRSVKPPAIPFLGCHLRELAFVEESMPNIVGKNMINFHKCEATYSLIEEVLKFRSIVYPFHPIHQIMSLLNFSNGEFVLIKNENELIRLSLRVEPPNAVSVP